MCMIVGGGVCACVRVSVCAYKCVCARCVHVCVRVCTVYAVGSCVSTVCTHGKISDSIRDEWDPALYRKLLCVF